MNLQDELLGVQWLGDSPVMLVTLHVTVKLYDRINSIPVMYATKVLYG